MIVVGHSTENADFIAEERHDPSPKLRRPTVNLAMGLGRCKAGMTSYRGKMLPPIVDDVMLEKFAAALWDSRFPGRQSMLMGRSGQAQKGLDVLITTKEARTIGIQCKAVAKLTKAMLANEIAKALTHQPKIHQFVLLTSAPNDAELVTEAQRLTEQHEEQGLFSVTVYGWGEVMRLLEGHPAVVAQFFPEFVIQLEPAGEWVVLKIGVDLQIDMEDAELALFCSETAARMKKSSNVLVQVDYEVELGLLSDIQAVSAEEHPTFEQRRRRFELEAVLQTIAVRSRRLEVATMLLLLDSEVRSPWLIASPWADTAEVLRRLVSEVFWPAISSDPDLLQLKIRSAQREELVTWIGLPHEAMAEFTGRSPAYHSYAFVGGVLELGSNIALGHVLPAAIAKVAQFSDSHGVAIDHLRQNGDLRLWEWQVEGA